MECSPIESDQSLHHVQRQGQYRHNRRAKTSFERDLQKRREAAKARRENEAASEQAKQELPLFPPHSQSSLIQPDDDIPKSRPAELYPTNSSFSVSDRRRSHTENLEIYPHPQSGLLNGRPFKCDRCPQSFRRAYDLARHKRLHLAVRSFICSFCHRSFSIKDALEVLLVLRFPTSYILT